jgi:hypothetical protein
MRVLLCDRVNQIHGSCVIVQGLVTLMGLAVMWPRSTDVDHCANENINFGSFGTGEPFERPWKSENFTVHRDRLDRRILREVASTAILPNKDHKGQPSSWRETSYLLDKSYDLWISKLGATWASWASCFSCSKPKNRMSCRERALSHWAEDIVIHSDRARSCLTSRIGGKKREALLYDPIVNEDNYDLFCIW